MLLFLVQPSFAPLDVTGTLLDLIRMGYLSAASLLHDLLMLLILFFRSRLGV
jgi:hypothetical protein